MEKRYTILLDENQLRDLHQLLDSLLDDDMDMIDNPKTKDEIEIGREIRLECANKTMELFNIVHKEVEHMWQDEELGLL
jgi:hypothetical protein